jgi:hypothetical protein
MEELDKRLNECRRLQNTALDLSGLKIGSTEATKVSAVLPKWSVEAVLSSGINIVHAAAGYALLFRVLGLIRQLLSGLLHSSNYEQFGSFGKERSAISYCLRDSDILR